jgi:hypothetical protein
MPSRDGSISFDWADDHHTFRLGLGEISELQEKCDAGPVFIYARLQTGQAKLEDVTETLRIGLIGGGMAPVKAKKLVERYVIDYGFLRNVDAAIKVLTPFLEGVPEEEFPKSEAASQTDQNLSQEEKSDSPPSTETPQ